MHQGLQTQLRAHMGPNVAVICSGVDGDPDTLWSEERAAIAQAIPRRQREFAAGRAAARQAMKLLGWPACPVPANPDRSPCWPAGLTGSLSHSSTVCVVVLGRNELCHSIGIDIETDGGIEPLLWDTICSRSELAWLSSLPEHERSLQVSRIFTAKEALYKSRPPKEQTQLEFQSATTLWIRMSQDFQAFRIFTEAAHDKWHNGYCMTGQGFVISWVAEIARARQKEHTAPQVCPAASTLSSPARF